MTQESIINAKEKDILELIRVAALQPEQIDALIPSVVQQLIAAADNKEADIEKIIPAAKECILSDLFLKKFTSPFDEIFSHDEIKTLISFYNSDVMRKFFKTYLKTCFPIYPAFNAVVAELLNTSSNTKEMPSDKVTTITKENYQKEFKTLNEDAILKVHAFLCEPCKIVAPIFSDLSNELGDKIKFLKLDINEDLEISKELEVYSVPALLFFKKGKMIDRHVGLINREELSRKIQKTLL